MTIIKINIFSLLFLSNLEDNFRREDRKGEVKVPCFIIKTTLFCDCFNILNPDFLRVVFKVVLRVVLCCVCFLVHLWSRDNQPANKQITTKTPARSQLPRVGRSHCLPASQQSNIYFQCLVEINLSVQTDQLLFAQQGNCYRHHTRPHTPHSIKISYQKSSSQ